MSTILTILNTVATLATIIGLILYHAQVKQWFNDNISEYLGGRQFRTGEVVLIVFILSLFPVLNVLTFSLMIHLYMKNKK